VSKAAATVNGPVTISVTGSEPHAAPVPSLDPFVELEARIVSALIENGEMINDKRIAAVEAREGLIPRTVLSARDIRATPSNPEFARCANSWLDIAVSWSNDDAEGLYMLHRHQQHGC